MKYLILKRGAKTIAEKKLDELPVKFKVGAAYSHILTENDRKVSVPHLEVERHKRDIFIQDLGSAFGTFVNGTAVERRYTLQDGDVISLGEHTLAFVERENSQDLPEESSDSTSLTTGPEYELVALQGPYKGTRYALADTVTHIGRERDNHVVLRQTPDGSVDNSISRKHAAVSYRNGRSYEREIKRGNGTLLIGERFTNDEETRLNPDDEN